jgi:hypothetical protein
MAIGGSNQGIGTVFRSKAGYFNGAQLQWSLPQHQLLTELRATWNFIGNFSGPAWFTQLFRHYAKHQPLEKRIFHFACCNELRQ